MRKSMRKNAISLTLGMSLLTVSLACAGRALVVNRPGKADIIVVLAGEEERRPERGIQSLHAGDAPRMILDVPANAKVYQSSQLELAQHYVQQLPEANAISLCPIAALSTKGEAHDVERCLAPFHVRTVLLVTSDYHSRRALSTFEKRLPRYQYRIAPAADPKAFGVDWWQRREWAKTLLGEWSKLIWWEVVDRWFG
jgi:uncharacterized SAM-binding protein YcdF (DUF218 family)